MDKEHFLPDHKVRFLPTIAQTFSKICFGQPKAQDTFELFLSQLSQEVFKAQVDSLSDLLTILIYGG